MNKRINSVLEGIRNQLEAEGEDTTYGPGIAADVGGASTQDAEAGSGGAINPPDVSDTLDIYVTEIADLISLEYDQTPEQALKFVFNAATALSKDGLVPPMPSDGAPPEEVAMWLGKAKSIQFSNHVMQRARDMLAK
jgi:hypothetical protein